MDDKTVKPRRPKKAWLGCEIELVRTDGRVHVGVVEAANAKGIKLDVSGRNGEPHPNLFVIWEYVGGVRRIEDRTRERRSRAPSQSPRSTPATPVTGRPIPEAWVGREVQLMLEGDESSKRRSDGGARRNLHGCEDVGHGRLEEVNDRGVVVSHTGPSRVADWVPTIPPPIAFHPWGSLVSIRLVQTQEEMRQRSQEIEEIGKPW